MTKAQVHAFNWLFLFVIAGVVAVHLVAAFLLGAAVGIGLFVYFILFIIIWAFAFFAQLNWHGQAKARTWFIFNIIFTPFWIVVYIVMNSR